LVVLLGGIFFGLIPYLTQKRPAYTATPSLTGELDRAFVVLKPKSQACIEPVPLSDKFGLATVVAHLPPGRKKEGQKSVPLLISAKAPGYRSSTKVAGYPVGVDTPVEARLTPPPVTKRGSVCIKNLGKRPVSFIGTREPRFQSMGKTLVDGQLANVPIALTLQEPAPHSLVERANLIFDRASLFTGGYIPGWAIWIIIIGLGGLTLIGLPWSLWRSFGKNE
jgi:hypothetical protein